MAPRLLPILIGNPEDVAMTEISWVSLVGHLIWPVTVLVLVLVLRRQIGDFLSDIGGRIKQVSVMSVTIELAVATETVPSWRGMGGEDVRGLVAAQQVERLLLRNAQTVIAGSRNRRLLRGGS